MRFDLIIFSWCVCVRMRGFGRLGEGRDGGGVEAKEGCCAYCELCTSKITF